MDKVISLNQDVSSPHEMVTLMKRAIRLQLCSKSTLYIYLITYAGKANTMHLFKGKTRKKKKEKIIAALQHRGNKSL